MKIIVLLLIAVTVSINQKVNAQIGKRITPASCTCVTNNRYGVEYPSTGNGPTGSGTSLLVIPTTDLDLNNVKKIHLHFPLSICNSTQGSFCYGSYKAEVNGQSYYTTGNQQGNNTDIEIPITVLHPGNNSILITGNCGVSCSLPSLVVAFLDPTAFTASITMTKVCCTSASGPHNTINNTGKVRFKMGGTASPYTKLKIAWSTGGYQIINFIADDGSGNGFTVCDDKPVTITVLNAFGTPIIGATINGSPGPYVYARHGRGNLAFDPDCLKTKGPATTPRKDIIQQ